MPEAEPFYDQYARSEWERLERHKTEFAVTMLALQEHLPLPPASVLDIGGGPGRYSIALSQLGYQVTLVDLSRNSLTLAAEKAAEAQVEIDQIIHANVLDLGMITSSTFQAAIIMGPLYHLLIHKERVLAIKEALRVVEPGGIVGAALITRFAPFRQAAVEEQEWLADEHAYAMKLLESGIHDQATMFANAYFIHPYDVNPLMESVGLQTILLLSVEGIVAGHEDGVNALQGSAWETWVELNYQLGQDASLYGASDHLLYLGQKSSDTNL